MVAVSEALNTAGLANNPKYRDPVVLAWRDLYYAPSSFWKYMTLHILIAREDTTFRFLFDVSLQKFKMNAQRSGSYLQTMDAIKIVGDHCGTFLRLKNRMIGNRDESV